ncbi:caspase domain-containing protein [Phaeobacter sp. HF9A]|uniref:caspase domain-containing protein n=1 Tax=Phaeobacter sp. HF9A TaxID=2721561 RepID=UPI0034C5BF37
MRFSLLKLGHWTRYLVLLCCMFWAGLATADERMALVVGNSSYGSVASLENPVHDAQLMARTLEELGFDVTLLTDASQVELKRAIAQFGRSLRAESEETVGLFYYAGHGVQSFGNNYLLPVDVALNDAADLDLVAVEAQSVLRQMASARNATNIVILDACRNNPFMNVSELNDNGLAEMQAPTGTFLSYATAPGDVAMDGADGNSPFTKALAQEMRKANEPIEQVLKQVRRAVLDETDGRQTPWDSSSLVRDFVFNEKQAEEELSGSAAEIAEEQLWTMAQESRDAVQLMLFLRAYGKSPYADQARALLSEISMEAQATTDGQVSITDETAMFEAAHEEDGTAALEAYLQAFPKGRYAELAEIELATRRSGAGEDTDLAPAPNILQSLMDTTLQAQIESGPITYDKPLRSELEQINGLTIAEVVTQSPMFPPVAGLPEEYWKTQSCSNCHNWTRDALCTQAKTYLTADLQRSLSKQHPFGGALKQALRSWAGADCQ